MNADFLPNIVHFQPTALVRSPGRLAGSMTSTFVDSVMELENNWHKIEK
jgi:hypothetical protein